MNRKRFLPVCLIVVILVSTATACSEPDGVRTGKPGYSSRNITRTEVQQAEQALVERTEELLLASAFCADAEFVQKNERRFGIFGDQIDKAGSTNDKMAAIDRFDAYLDDYEKDLEMVCKSSSGEGKVESPRSSDGIAARPARGFQDPPTPYYNPTDRDVQQAMSKAGDRFFKLLLDPLDTSTCQKPELKEKYRQLTIQPMAEFDNFNSNNLAKMKAVEDLNAILNSYEGELTRACDLRSDENIGNPTLEDVYVNAVSLAKKGASTFHGIRNCPSKELVQKYQRLFRQYGPVLQGKPDNKERIRSLIDYHQILEEYKEASVAACGGRPPPMLLFEWSKSNPAEQPPSRLGPASRSHPQGNLSYTFFDNLLCGTSEAKEQQKSLFLRTVPVVWSNSSSVGSMIQPIDDPKLDVYDEDLLSACYR